MHPWLSLGRLDVPTFRTLRQTVRYLEDFAAQPDHRHPTGSALVLYLVREKTRRSFVPVCPDIEIDPSTGITFGGDEVSSIACRAIVDALRGRGLEGVVITCLRLTDEVDAPASTEIVFGFRAVGGQQYGWRLSNAQWLMRQREALPSTFELSVLLPPEQVARTLALPASTKGGMPWTH
jgi:hypothetical protein